MHGRRRWLRTGIGAARPRVDQSEAGCVRPFPPFHQPCTRRLSRSGEARSCLPWSGTEQARPAKGCGPSGGEREQQVREERRTRGPTRGPELHGRGDAREGRRSIQSEPLPTHLDYVARAECLEDLEDQFLLVWAELHDGLPDILLGRVPEHVKLRLIGPHHVARSAQPVQRNGRVLEEVDELGVLCTLLEPLEPYRCEDLSSEPALPISHVCPGFDGDHIDIDRGL